MQSPPYILSIAGSDSSGGAGIQADIKTFNQLDCQGATVITAVTAQNATKLSHITPLDPATITSQLDSLECLQASVVKLGMVYNQEIMTVVSDFISRYTGLVICDPIIKSSSGTKLLLDVPYFISHIIPKVYLLTPNIFEAELLADMQINTSADIILAARKILDLGVAAVLIKGGHSQDPLYSTDYFSDGRHSYWLTNYRVSTNGYHGSGCVMAASISSFLALGNSISDAVVMAKTYITQAIRSSARGATAVMAVPSLAYTSYDLPWITRADSHFGTTKDATKITVNHTPSKRFPQCPYLGLYPIVDNVEWLEKLLPLGIKTIQLRLKSIPAADIENQIKQAVLVADKYQARLFINDYWQLALKYKAYGVHLGQEDLQHSDIDAIFAGGLYLGISSHSYYEIALAHGLRPSYIACGSVFATKSKPMPFFPQGIEKLQKYKNLLSDYQLVAIGGISLNNIKQVTATGIKNIAVISAITAAVDSKKAVSSLLAAVA